MADRGPNRKAVDDTLRAVGSLISAEHAAITQLIRSLADACDADPKNASLWREYRGAINDLGAITKADIADGYAELIGRLRTPLGDAANGAPDDRTTARADR